MGKHKHKKEEEDRRGLVIGGLIVLGVGLIFFLGNMGIIPHAGQTWPLILMVVGVALLIGALIKKEPDKKDTYEPPNENY